MTFSDAVADFRPTHVVPQEGLPAWDSPDVTRPTVPLDAFLPVQLLSRRGEWGEVLCSNGWSAWVDGRLLVAVPQPPPTTGGSAPTRADDPRPQLDRAAEALAQYRRALGDLATGTADGETFRRAVRGVRAGVVIDGEAVWLYDASSGRWLYGDGTRLATYAVVAGPGATPAPGPPPADAAGGTPGAGPPAGPGGAGPQAAPDEDTDHAATRIVEPPGGG